MTADDPIVEAWREWLTEWAWTAHKTTTQAEAALAAFVREQRREALAAFVREQRREAEEARDGEYEKALLMPGANPSAVARERTLAIAEARREGARAQREEDRRLAVQALLLHWNNPMSGASSIETREAVERALPTLPDEPEVK